MEKNYCTVSTLSALYALQNHIEGECAYCEEDEKMYVWQENDGWQPMTFNGQGLGINLYDLNKSVISQLPELTMAQIREKMQVIEQFMLKKTDKHFMLLCNEQHYYTIFEHDNLLTFPTFGAAVCEIITNLGKVYSIELTEDEGAIEIWIALPEEEQPSAYYLFPYDAGVVYYG